MSEPSQSRYGIMEELNEKKLNAKREIATLEGQLEDNLESFQADIGRMTQQIGSAEGTYKIDHARAQAVKESEIRLTEKKAQQTVERLREEIKEAEENYEENFQQNKNAVMNQIKGTEKRKELFRKQQERKINATQDILKEIDIGIQNLKDISKEQKSE